MNVYQIDLTRLLENKSKFYSLSIACPPHERSVAAEARLLGIELPDAAKAVIKNGSRFVSLPKDEKKRFDDIRSRARRTFDSFAVYFPFLPDGMIAVDLDREAAFRADLNDLFAEFETAKTALVEKLDGLKAARRGDFMAAGEAVYAAKTPTYEDGTAIPRETFRARWERAFERAFPTRADVERTYRFRLEPVAAIRKTLDIATKGEFLADAETAAKLRVIEESESLLRKEFYDFTAAAVLNLRVGLLQALQPLVDGLHDGRSVGAREIARVEKHVDDIRRRDVFGDAKLEDVLAAVRKATDALKVGVEGVAAARAKVDLENRLEDVKDDLKSLEFDPTSFRKLELDGDEQLAEVFTDREVQAAIRESMAARLAEAVRDLAAKGGSAEDRANAEDRLRVAVGLQKLADAGADEGTLDVAKRFLVLDTAEAPTVTIERSEESAA